MSGTGRKLAFGLGAVVIAGGLILWPRSSPKAAAAVSSCDPYVLFVKPDGIVYYYRYDGSPLKWGGTNIPDGHYGGQGGSDHHEQYYLDGTLIPIFSGECPPNCAADGFPVHIDPAPYRDVPTENDPSKTICDKYRQGNGPRAKPCPSNQTIAQYSVSVKAMVQWKLDPLCGHFPTPTPTGGASQTPTVTPSWTPTPTPAVTSKPTVPPTAVPTATKTPCQVCIPCTPVERFTPQPTSQPRFTPTKKAA